MINKTFNSDSTDNRVLEVGRNGERPWLNIREFDLENTMFMIAQSDTPALALAILEAAVGDGPGASNEIDTARLALIQEVQRTERITAEAKDKAELEAEALVLENARCEALEVGGFNSFDDLPAHKQMTGLAVARKAREMRAEK